MPARELAVLPRVAVDAVVALELAEGQRPLERAVVGGHVVAPAVGGRVEREVVLSVAHPADVVVHLGGSRWDHRVVVDQDPRAVDARVERGRQPCVTVGPVAGPVGVRVGAVQLAVGPGAGLDVQPRLNAHGADEPGHVDLEDEVHRGDVVNDDHPALEGVQVAVVVHLELGRVREPVLQVVR